jgi:general secretion pathway protein E
MPALLPAEVARELAALDPASYDYATAFCDLILAAAREVGASDLHLQPTAAGLSLSWRLDGVLQPLGEFSRGKSSDVIARLKVLAQLLTYKSDVPQEGRIPAAGDCEMRVSTFPTLHGERAAIRLFAAERRFLHVADLGLPREIADNLSRLLQETSGAILITGPAGSGKSTTAYACLRDIARAAQGRRSLVSLEDPIEVAVPGVWQSQVNETAGFDLPTGLRSLMRQDPEVILVGEVRDPATAVTVFQASLTGHLVLSTLHAGSAARGVARLVDMGIEPYLVRSGLRAILSQRLVRRLCSCARPAADESLHLGLPVSVAQVAVGCGECRHTGYRGRVVLAEQLPPLEGSLGRGVLDRVDAVELERLALAADMVPLLARGCAAVSAGLTDPAEIRRVLGFDASPR